MTYVSFMDSTAIRGKMSLMTTKKSNESGVGTSNAANLSGDQSEQEEEQWPSSGPWMVAQ